MNLLTRLLRKNLSKAQLAGFILSNFAGLAIVIGGVQFYCDVKALWDSDDGFMKKDYVVVNKKVTSANTLGSESTEFTDSEMEDLSRQPWVRSIGEFSSSDYRVTASVSGASGRNLSTFMFFESVPSGYLDVKGARWGYRPGDCEVPIIISKDYLSLYNFGFATSAGMPQISEQMMASVPMRLNLSDEYGVKRGEFSGRVVGFSNRLNTILVPQEFMDWSNKEFGRGSKRNPSRLIIDVNSPGDVAISDYLSAHGLEEAGDKSSQKASYFLNIVTGVVLAVGLVITILSLFILLLSISLLMQKNKEKLHSLIMLGYPLGKVGATYRHLVLGVSILSLLFAIIAMLVFRTLYAGAVEGLSGEKAGIWVSCLAGLLLASLIAMFNIVSVNRKVRESFR